MSYKIIAPLAMVGMALGILACSDAPEGQLGPEGPRFSHGSDWNLKIVAVAVGNTNCDGTTKLVYYTIEFSEYGPVPVEHVMHEWAYCQTYAGGFVDVSITIGGETQRTETLAAEILTDFWQFPSPLPSGATVSLTATPNLDHPLETCEFLGWREPGMPMFSTNRQVTITDSGPHEVIAEFECGSGGGPI